MGLWANNKIDHIMKSNSYLTSGLFNVESVKSRKQQGYIIELTINLSDNLTLARLTKLLIHQVRHVGSTVRYGIIIS